MNNAAIFKDFKNFDLNRYEKDVAELEKKPKRQNNIVFYGSSTFTLWKEQDLWEVLKPHKPVNNAFGGSTAIEALYYSEPKNKIKKLILPQIFDCIKIFVQIKEAFIQVILREKVPF